MNLLIPHLHYPIQYHIFSTLFLSQNRSIASDFRLPPDVRGPDVRPLSEIRSLAPEKFESNNSDFRLSPDVRSLFNYTVVPDIYTSLGRPTPIGRPTPCGRPDIQELPDVRPLSDLSDPNGHFPLSTINTPPPTS